MASQASEERLALGSQTKAKLEQLQRRVWAVKVTEGVLAALFGLVISYLVVLLSDRVWDTPALARTLILLVGAAGLGIFFPMKCHRWVWRTRTMEQVARLLKRKMPRLGDQILGVVELARSEDEQQRSRTLVKAAISTVEEAVQDQDLENAVPDPRRRTWAWVAGVPAVIAVVALLVVPEASWNALARWLMPWRDIDRYTFAKLDELPKKKVVPYAESFEVNARLSEKTKWSPAQGTARVGRKQRVAADLEDGKYKFQIPPQKESGKVTIRVGDTGATVEIEPKTRPELTKMEAKIELPKYLQYKQAMTKPVNGGGISVLQGSHVSFIGQASRALVTASMDGAPARIVDGALATSPTQLKESRSIQIDWQDEHGLAAKEPLVLQVNTVADTAPTVVINDLQTKHVLLSTEVLSFRVQVSDDFGVKHIGLEWRGVKDPIRNPKPADGEKLLAGGAPEEREFDVLATFSAKEEGMKPQTIELRAFAEDFLPGRKRTYSSPFVIHVLSPQQHAIWMTKQLARWVRQAGEVYEKEQQLHDVNRQLRQLTAKEIDQPANRRKIEQQAAAERANAARLGALTGTGKQLIEQAARNDQFNVRTLETWAEMLQKLEDIAGKRMPSVADLLSKASNAKGQGKPKPGQGEGQKSPPTVGNNRGKNGGKGQESKKGPPNTAPGISDVESGFNKIEDQKKKKKPGKSGSGRLTLPGTTLQGGPMKKGSDKDPPPQQDVDKAVDEQADLLTEFEKVRAELQKILSNLEQSTFVKRLKAASRGQIEVAQDINRILLKSFGSNAIRKKSKKQVDRLAEREDFNSRNVDTIQRDLEAYFNRKKDGKLQVVINEMKQSHVVSKLRDIGESVKVNLNGQSIAKAEFWGDALDRWAEQLVGPGCPGGT